MFLSSRQEEPFPPQIPHRSNFTVDPRTLSQPAVWHFPDRQKPMAEDEDEDEKEEVEEWRIRHLVPFGSAMYTISSLPVREGVTGEQATKQSSSLVLRSHAYVVPFGKTELSAEQTSLL